MPGDLVVDASVVAKLYFVEDQSNLAVAALRHADRLIAPELLFLEIASLAAKRTRRGTETLEHGIDAVRSVASLLDEAVPLVELAPRAFDLAARYGFSAYDGAYLALAESRGLELITADMRLVRLTRQVRLGHIVRPLADEGPPG